MSKLVISAPIAKRAESLFGRIDVPVNDAVYALLGAIKDMELVRNGE